MFRDKGKKDIDPDQLINTVARIGIKPASDQDEVPASLYFPRKGSSSISSGHRATCAASGA